MQAIVDIFLSDNESNFQDINMNTVTVQTLSADNEYSLPDSADVIGLNCSVPNVLPKKTKQFLSSD